MNLIIWLVVGGVIGWLASLIMKTDAQQGLVLNVVVGIVGALLGGWSVPPGGCRHRQSRRLQRHGAAGLPGRGNHSAIRRQSDSPRHDPKGVAMQRTPARIGRSRRSRATA